MDIVAWYHGDSPFMASCVTGMVKLSASDGKRPPHRFFRHGTFSIPSRSLACFMLGESIELQVSPREDTCSSLLSTSGRMHIFRLRSPFVRKQFHVQERRFVRSIKVGRSSMCRKDGLQEGVIVGRSENRVRIIFCKDIYVP